MKFHKVEKDINFPILKLESETGRWELGLTPMIFGVRVRMGLKGRDSATLDYCAGADHGFQLELLMTVIQILETIPEPISEGELDEILPGFTIKPINKDPVCWPKLQQMAKEFRYGEVAQTADNKV